MERIKSECTEMIFGNNNIIIIINSSIILLDIFNLFSNTFIMEEL